MQEAPEPGVASCHHVMQVHLQGFQAGCCLNGLLVVWSQVLQAPKACSARYVKRGTTNMAQ